MIRSWPVLLQHPRRLELLASLIVPDNRATHPYRRVNCRSGFEEKTLS